MLDDATNTRFGDLMNFYEGLAADLSVDTSDTAFFLQTPTDPIGVHAQDFVFRQSTLVVQGFTPEPGPTAFLIGSGVIACLVTRRRRTWH
jgi:hypothetical protein